MLGGTVWSLANIIQWLSPEFDWQARWNTVVYIGILIVPTAWLLFSIKYTSIGTGFSKKIGLGFWIMPVLIYIAVISNDFHQLFYISQKIININDFAIIKSRYGPVFYIHTAYSYILVFSGMVILGKSVIQNFKKYGIHAYGLIIGVLTPLVGNIYFLFGPIPEGFPDPTPFFFGITGITFAWTIFGGRMLEVIEIAHDSIVQNISNGIVVLDLDDIILDINPAARRIIGSTSRDVIDLPIIQLLRKNTKLKEILITGMDQIKNGESQHIDKLIDEQSSYEVVFTQIRNNLGFITGSLVEFRDISEKIQVEERLASTREVYESTMDALQDSYFEADPIGTITYANKAFATNLGFRGPEDVIGKNFRNFTDRKVVRGILEKFKHLYKTKKPLDPFEYHYRTKDGTIYIGETVVSPILDGDRIVGSRGTIRDITERVKTEREIAAQKDLLDGLLQNAPFAIVINDLENKITVTNPAFQKMFGYSSDEVLGKELDDLLSTPDLIQEMKSLTIIAMEDEIFQTGKRRTKDGGLVDVDISSVPFYVNDGIYGNLVFYQDISERLKAEAEIANQQITINTILDSLDDPYFEADKLGNITYSNNAFVKNIGYDSKEELIGRNFRHITERKKVRGVFEKFQKFYATGTPIKPFEYHYRRKDGQIFIGEIVVSPIIENGEVIGSRGIIRDISIRIEAEEVLRQAKEAAEFRADELATINRVAEKVGQTLDLQEILDSVCQELTSIFEVKNAGLGLINKEKEVLEIVAFHSNLPEEENAQGTLIPINGNPYFQELDDHKKTIVIQDPQTDSRMEASNELFRNRGTNAIMIVPLLIRGRVIGNIGLPVLDPNHQFTDNEIKFAETIASQIAFAIENAQLYTQTETALGAAESDLEIGSQIQSGFFPNSRPALPGWEIAAHFQSARQVAGDFYDIFQFKDSDLTSFVIADVCDKGVGAALFMVLFRSLLRAFSDLQIDRTNVHDRLLEIILNTNNYIAQIHGQSNMFATIFFGILDPESGLLHFINGGHEPPLILNSEGEIIKSLDPTGPAVGLFPDLQFSVESIQLNCGDILFGYTDGVTDAKSKTGELFTMERMINTIKPPRSSVFSMIFELEAALNNHIGGQDQYDDITMISFKRKISEGIDLHLISRPVDIGCLDELREFVVTAASHCSLNSEDIFAFKLSTEEIITNIIQYGYPDKHPGLITLSFEKEDDQARLKIWDDGLHFPLDQAETPDTDAGWEERKIGGLGIHFVKEMMDEVSYMKDDNNTNLLILEKRLEI